MAPPPITGVDPRFGQFQVPGGAGAGQIPGAPRVPPAGNVNDLAVVRAALQGIQSKSDNLAQALEGSNGALGGDQLAALNNASQQFGINQTAYEVAVKASQSFLRTVKQTASGWFA